MVKGKGVLAQSITASQKFGAVLRFAQVECAVFISSVGKGLWQVKKKALQLGKKQLKSVLLHAK